MGNPLRGLAREFIRREPETWLFVGISIATVQAISALYAARAEGVLIIPGGIGLLQNYGLLANLIGNACFPYLARRYYQEVMTLASSDSIAPTAEVEQEKRLASAFVAGHGKAVSLLYLFCFIGACFWIANTSLHVFGFAERYWEHRVFDSPDHSWSFALNRINNFYTWVILLPLCGHVLVWSSIHLRKIFRAAVQEKAATFDILDPDRMGGYLAVENAKVIFNVILAAVYIDVSLHTGTFRVIHFDHALAYVAATMILLFGNMLVFREANGEIKALRRAAINARKHKVYEEDALSFEILKYVYSVRPPRTIENFVIKAVPIVGSLALKLAPVIAQVGALQSSRLM
jgi:hypothetical protein